MTAYLVLPIIVAFVGGLILGLAHLVLLREGVRLILHDKRAGLGAALGMVRLTAVCAGFWVVVQFGAAALIAALAGFTAMRVIGIRTLRGPSWT